MAAHRYCRLLFGDINGGNATAVQFITLAGTDGVNHATSTTAISGDPNTEIAASNAIVGQAGEWASTLTTGAYLIYDFGAGNSYDIEAVGLTVCNFTAGFPTSVAVQTSDTNNGSDWSTAWSATIPPQPAAGQVFNLAAPSSATLPAGAHRYWQINITANYGGAYTGFQKIALAESDGVNRATVAAAASASSSFDGQPASNAIAGQPGAWGTVGGQSGWWAYDFGTNAGYAVSQVTITAQSDSNGTVYDPQAFAVRYSDTGNGTDWVTAWSVSDTAAVPAPNEVRTYNSSGTTVTPTPPPTTFPVVSATTPQRFWRVYVRQTGSAGAVGTSAIRLNTIDGVNQATVPANASTSAFDGNTPPGNAVVAAGQRFGAGDWAAGTTLPAWWAYDFGAGNGYLITSVCITSRGSQFFAQAPTDFDIQWSADGNTWNTQFSVNGDAPSANASLVRIYHDPALPVAATLPLLTAPQIMAFEGFSTYAANTGAGGAVSEGGAAGLFGPTLGFFTWTSPTAAKPDGTTGWGADMAGGRLALAADPVTLTLGERLTTGTFGVRVATIVGVTPSGPLLVDLQDAYGVTLMSASIAASGAVTVSVPAFGGVTAFSGVSAETIPGRFAQEGLYLEMTWEITRDQSGFSDQIDDEYYVQQIDTPLRGTAGVGTGAGLFGTAQSLGRVAFSAPAGTDRFQQTYTVGDVYLAAASSGVGGQNAAQGDVHVISHALTPAVAPALTAAGATAQAVAGPAPAGFAHVYLAVQVQGTYAQSGTGAVIVQGMADRDGPLAGTPHTLPAAPATVHAADVFRSLYPTALGGTAATGAETDASFAAGGITASLNLQAIASGQVSVTGQAFTSLVRSIPKTMTPTPPATPASVARGYAFIMA